MQYVKQEVFARLIMYNFCVAVVAALSPSGLQKEGRDFGSQQDASEDSQNSSGGPVKKVGIEFTKAVTACRMIIVNRSTEFIRDAINTIRAHTYESKADRSYPRNVKPKSFKPFNHKPS